MWKEEEKEVVMRKEERIKKGDKKKGESQQEGEVRSKKMHVCLKNLMK